MILVCHSLDIRIERMLVVDLTFLGPSLFLDRWVKAASVFDGVQDEGNRHESS